MASYRPMYRKGDRAPDVVAIREALQAQGLLVTAVDTSAGVTGSSDHFDDACDQSVRAFQQSRGLLVDGSVGPETWRSLRGSRFTLGDRQLAYRPRAMLYGDDVAALQERLLELGYDAGLRDNIFGPTSDRALRAFQRDYGMASDGICGPETQRSLRQLGRSVVGGRPHMMREAEKIFRHGPSLTGKRIMIDPGHGGEDPGAVWEDLREADLVWDLAKQVTELLAGVGAEALLSRERDEGPDDGERARAANEAEVDMLISLHLDQNVSPFGQGVAGYHFGTGAGVSSDVGENLAGLLSREVAVRAGLRDLGIHAKTWDLLRLSRMPAVRLDVGYLTSEEDRAMLSDPDGRRRIAEGVLIGIQRLYLPPERDRATGTIDLTELRSAGRVTSEGANG